MNQSIPQTLKGFRDFLPAGMRVRNYVKKICIETFESFGFEPLETPTLEYASTLMGKNGDEADKLVYQFKDNGDRNVGLRYDLTVPTAKVLAIYQQQLPLPFKRYQLQPVWRAEKPQKGRYREVLQCDIDTFGPVSPLNDAEMIAVIYTILQKLNFKKFQIKINSRQVLFQIISQSGLEDKKFTVLQSIDKLNKIGQDGVNKELISKDVPEAKIKQLFNYIKDAQPDEYLKVVFAKIAEFDIPQTAYSFDPTMVRGLDYYTGPIFETYVEEPRLGSITGGGRYDQLVKTLGGPDIPAVGTTIGLDRIVDCITELNLLPELQSSFTKVLVANFGPESEKESISLASYLRTNNIPTLFYPTADKLGKQFAYADTKNIPFVAAIGTDELKVNKIMLKNMAKKEQKLLDRAQLISFLSTNIIR